MRREAEQRGHLGQRARAVFEVAREEIAPQLVHQPAEGGAFRLQAGGIQRHFMLGDIGQLETVERLIRRGIYAGPLVLNHVMIGGGADGPNPANMMELIRRGPAGAVLTIESIMRNVLPLNTMAIAMGLHVRVGIEDNLWGHKGQRITNVQQVEQMVRTSRELYREVATSEQAMAIYQIGTQYKSADETLAKLGWALNRGAGQCGATLRLADQGRAHRHLCTGRRHGRHHRPHAGRRHGQGVGPARDRRRQARWCRPSPNRASRPSTTWR